jgi:NAD+ synthase (glutamine-hydrolysing)
MSDDYGFLRVAACSPRLALADPDANADYLLDAMRWAGEQGAALLVTPEMGLTGYTCHDLFHQQTLLDAALRGLHRLLDAQRAEKGLSEMVVAVGMPLVVRERLYNCAALIQGGRVLGVIPKTYLPNYGEFYDERYFAGAREHVGPPVAELFDGAVPFSPNLLFRAPNEPGFTLGLEICEDAWSPIPRCAVLATAGARVIANLSASNELIGKAEYRRDIVVIGHSATCVAGYIYAGAGTGESSTDTVFGGHCLIAENGSLLAEGERFVLDERVGVCADLDLGRLGTERRRLTSFAETRPPEGEFLTIPTAPIRRWSEGDRPLRRFVNPTPFVPSNAEDRRHRCEEIFHIQTTALARRSRQVGHPPFVIGVSGGLDSTLAMLVCSRTLQRLGRKPEELIALTMPGFGTTQRTRSNAEILAEALTGRPAQVVDIRAACRQHFHDIGHPAAAILDRMDAGEAVNLAEAADVAFENVQARERTQILMDVANQAGGLVIGTGDLSEIALGWNTYNGDHMSMYAVNCSVPKTLVQYIVRWAAEAEFEGKTRDVLLDILETPISPELLPAVQGVIAQETEGIIGPYVLHDFFLFNLVRGAAPPDKIVLLAKQAFEGRFEEAEIKKWLAVFLRRFFANQFKRSCVPDGPKVGTVSLSPRADWRMPSDAQVAAWLKALEADRS